MYDYGKLCIQFGQLSFSTRGTQRIIIVTRPRTEVVRRYNFGTRASSQSYNSPVFHQLYKPSVPWQLMNKANSQCYVSISKRPLESFRCSLSAPSIARSVSFTTMDYQNASSCSDDGGRWGLCVAPGHNDGKKEFVNRHLQASKQATNKHQQVLFFPTISVYSLW